jgi:hypothetical protein
VKAARFVRTRGTDPWLASLVLAEVPSPAVSKATRSATQLRFKFGRERKDTDPVATLRAATLERARYGAIVTELLQHPMVLDAIRITFNGRGWFVPAGGAWRDRQFIEVSRKGRSDIWGVLRAPVGERRAVPLFLEVKREGEQPDPWQRFFLDHMQQHGCCAAVIHNEHEARDCINQFYRRSTGVVSAARALSPRA